MKRSRFSESQIIGILMEHQAGMSAPYLCRKHGISDAIFYNWRRKYGGMEVAGFASCVLSTTSAGNTWRQLSTLQAPASVSPGSWTGSARCAASLAWWSATRHRADAEHHAETPNIMLR